VSTHIINLNIRNNSSGTLVLNDASFQAGGLADGNDWPKTIANGATGQVQCCQGSGLFSFGCSGWVKYMLNDVPIFFSFSNPVVGTNGIDVGTDTGIWNTMQDHYFPVERPIPLSNDNWLNVTINSTGGDTNEATWNVEVDDVATIQPANLEMVNVEQVWSGLPTTGTRRYFRCDDMPTTVPGMVLSHLKGLSVYADKFIFTHTNLPLSTPDQPGKYMIADRLDRRWNQGMVDATLDTPHLGLAHPCSSQACGSFMAMGIQATANSIVSEIQILDIRRTRIDQAATLLGTIPVPDCGVNGVGMTKETGPDGRYLVAGINGTMLNVYRSTTSSLITNGAPTVQFNRVLHQDIGESGPGLALVTQSDGAIYMFALNADAGQDNNTVNLYKLDLQSTPTTCRQIDGTRHMQIPGMSDSVLMFEEFAEILGVWALSLLADLGAASLNSSFRYGKGLAITSPTTIEVYASDRNVLPLSQAPVVGSDKDFSVVTWASAGSTWNDQLYVLFQADDPGSILYVASSVDGTTFPAPAIGCDGIRIGGSPAVAVFNDLLYVAFQASDPSHTLYVSSSPDGVNFTTPADGYPQIPIGSAPAMAVFMDRLFIAFQANDPSNTLYVTSSADGRGFPPAVGYGTIRIGGSPAMAVMDNRLYIAFEANDPSHTLYITSTGDGTNFTTPVVANAGIVVGSAPAMAFYQDRLYIAFQAYDSSNQLYVTSSADGIVFATPVAYPEILIGGAPAMAARNDGLYISFQANDRSDTLYVTSAADGTHFTSPAIGHVGIHMGGAPAMVEFWGLVRS